LPFSDRRFIVNVVGTSPNPRILLIETSGRAGQVALACGENLLGVRRLDEARRHARDLAPALNDLLRIQGWKARELDAVFVGRGPGSYTGLRVGIMSAKTIAYASGCALLGIDTFAIIAQQSPNEADRLDVLADAQRGKVYLQSFQRGGAQWEASTGLSIVRFEDWLAQRDANSWVGGPGVIPYHSRLPETVQIAANSDPSAESLLALGLNRYRAVERDDPYTLEPLYLRPSAAEEQWKGRGR
jgi:tRNA threonylcarbamoyladenosine biosynthesis protein TsaB